MPNMNTNLPEGNTTKIEEKLNEYTITLNVELTKIAKAPAEVGDKSAEILNAFPAIVAEYLERVFDQVLIRDLKVFKTVDNNLE